MTRAAIFVDAGHFFAAGAFVLTNESVKRNLIRLKDPEALLKALLEKGADFTGNPSLLRMYWYDAQIGNHLTAEQNTLNLLPGLKLRLGSLNGGGIQKGVDSLIVTDLIELASKHAISDAVLISGDEDVRVAVTVAQSFGVRVHLLGIGDITTNTSPGLRIEADALDILEPKWLAQHLQIDTPTVMTDPDPDSMAGEQEPEEDVRDIALRVTKELLGERNEKDVNFLATLMQTTRTIPPEFDRPLIKKTAINLGRRLETEENRRIRVVFIEHVRSLGKITV